VTINGTPYCSTKTRSVAEIYLRFGAIYCLNPQGRRVNLEKIQQETMIVFLCLPPQCTLGPYRWREYAPWNNCKFPPYSAVSHLRKWLRAVREATDLRKANKSVLWYQTMLEMKMANIRLMEETDCYSKKWLIAWEEIYNRLKRLAVHYKSKEYRHLWRTFKIWLRIRKSLKSD
jgi:hypothetical protein